MPAINRIRHFCFVITSTANIINSRMREHHVKIATTGLKLVLPEAAHSQNSSFIQIIENCEENDACAPLEIELASDVGQQSRLPCHRPKPPACREEQRVMLAHL